MKYLLVLFAIGLFVINHNNAIQTCLSGSGVYNPDSETNIRNPVINTSIDSLHMAYSTIADTYDLQKTTNVFFIVNEMGNIHNPEFEGVDNPKATLKLIELIHSVEADPGIVSGKATSMGTSLKFVSR